jgi:hypothetical protein
MFFLVLPNFVEGKGKIDPTSSMKCGINNKNGIFN